MLSRMMERWHNNSQTYPPPVIATVKPRHHTWPKERYTPWMEWVKQNFPVGTLCTYADIAPKDTSAPVCYRVLAHNELWYDAEWDPAIEQPKGLCVAGVTYGGNPAWSCAPSRMRILTETEKALVDLQNRPVQGSA
jgi:hypothetical protein